MRITTFYPLLVVVGTLSTCNPAFAEEANSVTQRIQALVEDSAVTERCRSLQHRVVVADAIGLATSSIAVTVGGSALFLDNLAVQLAAVFLSGVSVGAFAFHRSYRATHDRECSLTGMVP